MNHRPTEGGQVLVLVILALVGLLGFAALAIDGGMIYSERRIDQNAADASALAGAGAIRQQVASAPLGSFVCTPYLQGGANWNLATNAAVARATDNNFDIGAINEDPADRPDGDVWLVCNDRAGNNLDGTGALYVDVHTRVTKPVSTSLMHLFNSGLAVNTVESVVRLYPHDTLAANTAILALRETADCRSSDTCLRVNGNIDIRVENGIVASNSKVEKDGGSGTFEVIIGGTTPPTGVYYGDRFLPGSNLAKAPNYPGTRLAAPITIPTFLEDTLEARCALETDWADDANTSGNYVLSSGSDSIDPGKYNRIEVRNSGRLTMNPGLYCVNEVDIRANSSSHYAVRGDGVTIFMDENAGNFSITATAKVQLSAPTEDEIGGPIPCTGPYVPSNNLEAIQGLLIWSAADGERNPMPQITMNGSATSEFTGSVVAPYTRVNLHGNVNGGNSISYQTQVIAYDVWVAGNSNLFVDFSNDFVPQCGGLLNQQK